MKVDEKELLKIAGRLLLNNSLDELYAICETNKTVSTAKLENMLNKASESLKQEAIKLRKIYDDIRELGA